jgi:hypothetical protein
MAAGKAPWIFTGCRYNEMAPRRTNCRSRDRNRTKEAPMAKDLPPVETLRQLLDYNPETGLLFWKPRPREMFKDNDLRICNTWNTRYAGKEALRHIDANGYKIGSVAGLSLKAHRLIWKLVFGQEPIGQIDHVNGIRHDNRLANLRLVNQAENQRNSGLRADNKSGHAGVFVSKTGKIRLYISGKYCGTFPTIESAVAKRILLEKELGFTGASRKRKGQPKPPQSLIVI